jgi:hypothetical protein
MFTNNKLIVGCLTLKQLAKDKESLFENGYAMFGLELLFFEPHGKYLSGNTITANGKCFRFGFDPFLKFWRQTHLLTKPL